MNPKIKNLEINERFFRYKQKDNHKISLFAIFSGNGGKEVLEYLQKFSWNFKKNILKSNRIENNIEIHF